MVDAIGQVEVSGVTGVPVDPVVIRNIDVPATAESTPSGELRPGTKIRSEK